MNSYDDLINQDFSSLYQTIDRLFDLRECQQWEIDLVESQDDFFKQPHPVTDYSIPAELVFNLTAEDAK